jgi:hypothetical protein
MAFRIADPVCDKTGKACLDDALNF